MNPPPTPIPMVESLSPSSDVVTSTAMVSMPANMQMLEADNSRARQMTKDASIGDDSQHEACASQNVASYANAGRSSSVASTDRPLAALVRILTSTTGDDEHQRRACADVCLLDKDIVKIGRNNTCDFAILNIDVSRVHATIEYRREVVFAPDGSSLNIDSWWIVDKSNNGTFLNRERLIRDLPTRLSEGSIIRIANCFIFRFFQNCHHVGLPPTVAPGRRRQAVKRNHATMLSSSGETSDSDGASTSNNIHNMPTQLANAHKNSQGEEDAAQDHHGGDGDDENVQVVYKKKQVANMLGDYVCPICLDFMHRPAHLIPCGHLFCSSCIEDWAKNSGFGCTCPKCRRKTQGRLNLPQGVRDLLELSINSMLTDTERAERNLETAKRQHNRLQLFQQSLHLPSRSLTPNIVNKTL